MNLKELFDNSETGALTWDQFDSAVKEAKLKLADLNSGQYVSKSKFDDEIAVRDTQIQTLNDTISGRDADLEGLRQQLADAGTDADKLNSLTRDFSDLQSKYDTDVKNYKNQLKKQAYEFAVKEFAGTKRFSSNAAKRDFIQSMINKDLKLEGDMILGAEDFVTAYSKDNGDAFISSDPEPSSDQKPMFVNPTPGGGQDPVDADAFMSAFNFTSIHND